MMSNEGMLDETIVEAYAEERVLRIGPVLSRPALKKYGEMLRAYHMVG